MKIFRNSLNLFDKENDPTLTLYCGDENIIRTAASIRSTYISCDPNTTYTISKIVSARFKVACTETEPAANIVYFDLQSTAESSITITTGNTAHYIIIEYYTSTYDTYTESEIRDTIMINAGSAALPFEPYNVVDWYGYKYKLRASGAWSELDDKKAPWTTAKTKRKKKSV